MRDRAPALGHALRRERLPSLTEVLLGLATACIGAGGLEMMLDRIEGQL